MLKKIDHNGSGRLEIKSEDNGSRTIIKRDPDARFQHDDALWPGVVIEVAYSQSSKDIPNLADDYSIILLETNERCRRAGYRLQYKKRAQFPYGVRIT